MQAKQAKVGVEGLARRKMSSNHAFQRIGNRYEQNQGYVPEWVALNFLLTAPTNNLFQSIGLFGDPSVR